MKNAFILKCCPNILLSQDCNSSIGIISYEHETKAIKNVAKCVVYIGRNTKLHCIPGRVCFSFMATTSAVCMVATLPQIIPP